MGILEQFKLTPDSLIATHLSAKPTRSKAESLLLKYVQQSHLFNTESSFFMSAAFSYDPAAITLGYMNKNRLGTNKNCSSSLAYYLAAIQRNYIEGYEFRQVYSLQDSLE
jgi:TPR repeat protein